MVPAIIIHCTNEIEARGLTEVGIYRVPGSEREVKELRDKFLAGQGCSALGQVDVHVLCGVVKDFLGNLREATCSKQYVESFHSGISQCVWSERFTSIFSGCRESRLHGWRIRNISGSFVQLKVNLLHFKYSSSETGPIGVINATALALSMMFEILWSLVLRHS